MSILSYTVTRNIDAEDEQGNPVKIALASVVHENGVGQTVAIPEALIRFAGESVIEREVMRAVGSPSDASLK
jgi:hypothetical protein